jgi:superoxide dismutase, Cu-Zn family
MSLHVTSAPTTRSSTRRIPLALSTVLLALAAAGCGGGSDDDEWQASADLSPTTGNQVRGEVRFREDGSRLVVSARVTGLTPNQTHGFHVHERGDCSAPDATSAGGHFNPTGQPHGPQSGPHHLGDMPSLVADASGRAETEFTLEGVNLDNPTTGFRGRGVIVHSQADDFTTQPTGNAGSRLACGVIR